MNSHFEAMVADLTRPRKPLRQRYRRKARKQVVAESHGHATLSARDEQTVLLWGSYYSRKGKLCQLRVELDEHAAERLYESLRNWGYGVE